MADDSGFLLQCTDEAAAILQKLVTDLHADVEQNMENTTTCNTQLGAPNRDAVELTYHMLSENLAKLWPCEKKYVAVIGPTGAGKTVLLNALIAMTCRTGKGYTDGILHGPQRIALRETARLYGRNCDDVDEEDIEVASENPTDPDSASMIPEGRRNQVSNMAFPVNIAAERQSVCGLLGMCCAQNREAYLSKHLAHQDRYPFLLLHGRMGDAGTTKVTAVQWGPQFACRLRWIEKKKLRKRCRELRKWRDDPNSSQIEESRINEYKELWERMLGIVDHPFQSGQVPLPTEELIESTLTRLAKKVSLGKIENIQTETTKGSVLDRLQVRDGVRSRFFDHKLGLLAEELIIEAPIPSSEGGVSLLDVPGTNDPRFLHQRETRDAIDRTALILLIVDKSVLDEATVKVLEDSPILERMLLDDSSSCSLVVVGIAEKGSHPNQSAMDIVANFDPNQDLMRAMKRIFQRTTKRLCKSRRLDMEVGRQRVVSIFEGDRFSVLPVLPLLCASLQLSRSNGELHKQFCESSGLHTCPLVMTENEHMKRCLETNIPKLLERMHAVRMPPPRNDLQVLLQSTVEQLKNLTQVSTYDLSMVDFLKREVKNAKRESQKVLPIESFLPNEAVDLAWIQMVLHAHAEECQMSSEDVELVSLALGNKSAIRAVNNPKLFALAPIIMHGFRPELIGKIAHKLIQPTEDRAAEFVKSICDHMEERLEGDRIWRDTTMDKLSEESLGPCYALIEEKKTRCQHNFHRVRGRWLCGDKRGGLLKDVSDALRKSCDRTMKHFLNELRKIGDDAAIKDRSLQLLNQNEAGNKFQEIAQKEIEGHLYNFWDSAMEKFQREASKMWESWLQQLLLLKKSVEEALEKEKVAGEEGMKNPENIQEQEDSVLKKLQGNVIALQSLQDHLAMYSDSRETVNYGYSLLQRSPTFEDELNVKDTTRRSNFIMALKVDINSGGAQQDWGSPRGQPSAGEPNLVSGSPSKQGLNNRQRTLGQPDEDSNLLAGSLAEQGSHQPATSTPTNRLTSPSNRLRNALSQRRRNVIPLSDTESQLLQQRHTTTPKKTPKRKRP